MNAEEEVALFQDLIDTGMAWQLRTQGRRSRLAYAGVGATPVEQSQSGILQEGQDGD